MIKLYIARSSKGAIALGMVWRQLEVSKFDLRLLKSWGSFQSEPRSSLEVPSARPHISIKTKTLKTPF